MTSAVPGEARPVPAGTGGPVVRWLGRADYARTWQAMQAFTASRTPDTPDELWTLEHEPVYTYGVAGRPEHLPPAASAIACIKVDRGGQVTYHGPGQAVVYTLLDLRRLRLTVRALVQRLEQSAIDVLAQFGLRGERREGAPGVYIDGAKIAALGLKVRNGCCYHGLSFNVDVDLQPFGAIDPCGYPGLAVTRLADFGVACSAHEAADRLVERIAQHLRDDF